MTSHPLVTILINNFNYGRFLLEAIESALGQTYQPVEVLVVDDGSTDDSREVIARYGGRVRTLFKPNGGQTSTFNAGFRHARGDVILFLDADDTLLPAAVENAVALFESGDVSQVHWPLWEIDAEGGRNGAFRPRAPMPEGDLKARMLAEGPDSCLHPPTSGSAWSRRFLAQVLPLPEIEREHRLGSASADACLSTLAPLFGRIQTIREPQGCYRIHGQNDYAGQALNRKVRHDFLIYTHRCALLEGVCRRLGLPADPEVWKRQHAYYRWMLGLQAANRRLLEIVPPGARLVLADDDQWRASLSLPDRACLPFVEKGGEYWGQPGDDTEAIRELERQRAGGAAFLVIGAPAFWWLEHYPAFHRHLRDRFRCVADDDAVVIFDLRTDAEPGRKPVVPAAAGVFASPTPVTHMTSSTIVCILGMHRSGTSATTRILGALGLYLGAPEAMLPPAPDNPKGFWEHAKIVELDERILARLGGGADEPPAFPPGWEAVAELEDLRREARALVERDFAGVPLWGWKDPRTCLTLPFWRQLLPPMRYVLCLRNPLDVARSLERRNNYSIEKSVHLWLTYVQAPLAHTAGQPRLVLFFEDLMEQWQPQLDRLAAFIGQPELAAQPDVREQVRQFLDKDLRHHAGGILEPTDESALGPGEKALLMAQRVYLQLKRSDAGCGPDVDRQLQSALHLLAPEVERQHPARQRWHWQMAEMFREIAGIVPPGETYILVDDAQCDPNALPGRRALPFVERDGRYWGPPANEAEAQAELGRLRQAGARFIVFAQPAFWWLKHYAALLRQLRADYPCRLENERLVAFDLRQPL